jgi:urease accessory protein
MLKVVERLDETAEAGAVLTLPFELRQKSRLRAQLDNGEEVGLMLPRGTVLRGGDCLRTEDGLVIQVQAAPESVSTAFTSDPRSLAAACYHLGNRHVALEIGDTWLRYLHDHVLDEMVRALGLRVLHEVAPFEPEGGAYESAHSHGHAHDHAQHH